MNIKDIDSIIDDYDGHTLQVFSDYIKSAIPDMPDTQDRETIKIAINKFYCNNGIVSDDNDGLEKKYCSILRDVLVSHFKPTEGSREKRYYDNVVALSKKIIKNGGEADSIDLIVVVFLSFLREYKSAKLKNESKLPVVSDINFNLSKEDLETLNYVYEKVSIRKIKVINKGREKALEASNSFNGVYDMNNPVASVLKTALLFKGLLSKEEEEQLVMLSPKSKDFLFVTNAVILFRILQYEGEII